MHVDQSLSVIENEIYLHGVSFYISKCLWLIYTYLCINTYIRTYVDLISDSRSTYTIS